MTVSSVCAGSAFQPVVAKLLVAARSASQHITEGVPPQPSRRTRAKHSPHAEWGTRGPPEPTAGARGPHPGRSPGSLDRSNAADAGGPSCYPVDLPKGLPHRVREPSPLV